MTELLDALAAPKKRERVPTDPHQKILKKLARLGWNVNGRGTKTLMARHQDSHVYITNTYAMRRFHPTDIVPIAIRAIVPDRVDERLREGFEFSLTASRGGEWMADGRRAPDMATVWPTEIPDTEIVHWESHATDSEAIVGHSADGVTVSCSAKLLGACVDGVEGPRVFVTVADDGTVRKPLVITDADAESVIAILMPRRG